MFFLHFYGYFSISQTFSYNKKKKEKQEYKKTSSNRSNLSHVKFALLITISNIESNNLNNKYSLIIL